MNPLDNMRGILADSDTCSRLWLAGILGGCPIWRRHAHYGDVRSHCYRDSGWRRAASG